MKRPWLLALTPFGLGLVIAGLVAVMPQANPTLYLRTDVSTLAALIGLILSGLCLTGLLLWGRAERERRQSVKQTQAEALADRRRFLQRLDHELKNPLTAIRAGLANLSDPISRQQPGEVLSSLEAQTLRLSRLTADLRKLAELDHLSLERAPVNLAELLEEALTLAREQPEAQGYHLTLILPKAPWPLPVIAGDWDLLFLTFYNLLNNALKYSRAGDTVEIRAFEDSASVVVEVADTGPGIPEEELPHVWEELYRGQGARGIEGSGLGLALARAIVERHHGAMTLRSRVGQGTVVAVRLPLVTER